MFRLPRLVIIEIISREGSSSMSEGFLEIIRTLNSISFKELKGNKSIVNILHNNTTLISFLSVCSQNLNSTDEAKVCFDTADAVIAAIAELFFSEIAAIIWKPSLNGQANIQID